MSGGWRLEGETLVVVEQLPAVLPEPPAKFQRSRGDYPGLQAQSITSHFGGSRWTLRWKTLGPNRDLVNRSAPPPSEMRLYEFPAPKSLESGRAPRLAAFFARKTDRRVEHIWAGGGYAGTLVELARDLWRCTLEIVKRSELPTSLAEGGARVPNKLELFFGALGPLMFTRCHPLPR